MTCYAFEGGVSTAPKTGALEITQAQYSEAITGILAGKVVTIAGGFAVIDQPKPVEPTPPAPTLDQAKQDALVRVNAGFAKDAAGLIGSYPEMERETWPNQQAEADAWHADNTAQTPYLDAISSARGVDAAGFRQAVYDRVTQFKTGSATLVGKRQKLSDSIDATTTIEAAQAIQW